MEEALLTAHLLRHFFLHLPSSVFHLRIPTRPAPDLIGRALKTEIILGIWVNPHLHAVDATREGHNAHAGAIRETPE